MPIFSEIAYAKINLALHVRSRRTDGYHDIETLFAFVDDGDQIEAEAADMLSLQIDGPFGANLEADESNLVLRTAKLLQHRYGVKAGAAIRLHKRLPIASGIGGGSADAAATARLLNRLWQLRATEAELAVLLAPLGADIPACVYSRTSFGRGTGVELELLADSSIAGKSVLLVNPLKAVLTAAIFLAWDGRDLGPIAEGDTWQAAQAGRNDLEPIALRICPEISQVLNALASSNSSLARMSGSGGTCFAIFESNAELQASLEHLQPNWWAMMGTLR
jgi:4-diphosphocytidyl-2-C-methyl-D-erythritol kinase